MGKSGTHKNYITMEGEDKNKKLPEVIKMYNTTNTYAAQPQQPTYVNYAAMNRPIYQTPQLTQPFMGLKGRPVASIEEARASIIDFDGSIFYFPDLANKKIYTKQINLDGTAILNMYELKEMPIEQEIKISEYITREEFETAISQLRAASAAPQTTPIEQPAAKPLLNF